MWAVEAKNYGSIDNPAFYKSGLTEAQSRRLHSKLSNSGDWPYVRSWDLEAEAESRAATQRINDYFQQHNDGVGEGQPV